MNKLLVCICILFLPIFVAKGQNTVSVAILNGKIDNIVIVQNTVGVVNIEVITGGQLRVTTSQNNQSCLATFNNGQVSSSSTSTISSSMVSSSLTTSPSSTSSISNIGISSSVTPSSSTGVSSSTLLSSSTTATPSSSSMMMISSSVLPSSSSGLSSSSLVQTPNLVFASSIQSGFYVNTDFAVASNPLFLSFNTDQVAQYTLYVDAQYGNDANFGNSSNYAFQSLAYTQSIIRLLLPTAHSNILVYLNGIFTLTQTWALHKDDSFSPSSPYFVVYKALNPFQKPLISGLYKLPQTWTLFNSTLNLYRLYVGSGFTTRSLYTNDRMATKIRSQTITSSPTSYALFNPVNNTLNCSACGLPSVYPYALVETVWNFQFEFARCPESILYPNGTIVVSIACPWRQVFYVWYFYSALLSWLENSIIFFQPNGTSGSWALDSPNGYVYYQPRAGEDMNTINATVSHLQTLLTTDPDASNLAFIDIDFAYSDWTNASLPTGTGNVQGDYLALSGSADEFDFTNDRLNPLIPAGVDISGNTMFLAQCTFRDMTTAGVHLNGFQNNSLFWNNTIQRIAASGIQIGNIYWNNQNYSVSNLVVEDNSIMDIGQVYPSALGIFAIFYRDSVLQHNYISNIPYGGIGSGLGWIDFDPTINQNTNTITFNHINNFLNGTQDSGAFYCNGHQPNTTLELNFFSNQLPAFFWEVFAYIPQTFAISAYDPPTNSGPFTFQNWSTLTPGIYLDQGCDYMNIGANAVVNVPVYIYSNSHTQLSLPTPTYLSQLSSNVNVSIQLMAGPRKAPLHLLAGQIITFGGMYSSVNVNNMTGTFGCNSTYTAVLWISGTGSYLNTSGWYCYKIITVSLGQIPDYTFGGVFAQGYDGTNGYYYNNPLLGTPACPSGYNQVLGIGAVGFDFNLFYCVKPYTNGDVLSSFGGFIGRGYNSENGTYVLYPNIFTSTWYCPTFFNKSQQIYGAIGFDLNATLCYNNTLPISSSSSATISSISSSYSSSFSSSVLSSSVSSSVISSSLSSSVISSSSSSIPSPPLAFNLPGVPRPYCYYPLVGNSNDYSGNGFHGVLIGAQPGFFAYDNVRGITYTQNLLYGGILTNCSIPKTFSIGGWARNVNNQSGSLFGTNTTFTAGILTSIMTVLNYFNYGAPIPSIDTYLSNQESSTTVDSESPSYALSSGLWNHIVMVYNATSLQGDIYINGQINIAGHLVNTGDWATYPHVYPSVTLAYGGYDAPNYPSNSFQGFIQALAIFNVTLTAQQIQTWYTNTTI